MYRRVGVRVLANTLDFSRCRFTLGSSILCLSLVLSVRALKQRQARSRNSRHRGGGGGGVDGGEEFDGQGECSVRGCVLPHDLLSNTRNRPPRSPLSLFSRALVIPIVPELAPLQRVFPSSFFTSACVATLPSRARVYTVCVGVCACVRARVLRVRSIR